MLQVVLNMGTDPQEYVICVRVPFRLTRDPGSHSLTALAWMEGAHNSHVVFSHSRWVDLLASSRHGHVSKW